MSERDSSAGARNGAGWMDALLFRHDVPRYLLSRTVYGTAPAAWTPAFAPLDRVRLPRPAASAPGWAVVRVRLAGICGTDASLLTGGDSLYLETEATYPFVPGHEIVGEIVEPPRGVQGAARLEPGTRVAIWAVLGCRARGIDPLCPRCAEGWDGLCERREIGWPGRALGIGFCRETGGGWSEAFLAHASQLWPLPDSVRDDDAVLLDPAATALAAILRTQEGAPRRTLVIGGGTIGLLCVHLARALGLPGEWTLVARHEFQRSWAERHGHRAVRLSGDREFHDWLVRAGAVATTITGYGRVLRGVFDRVIDAAGSGEAFRWSLDAVAPRGLVALVSAPATITSFDPTPLWYREITLRGIYDYGPVPWRGESRHPYEVLLPLLEEGTLSMRDAITHVAPLGEAREALSAAVHRGRSGAIKVVLKPGVDGP